MMIDETRFDEPNETTYMAMETAENNQDMFGPFDSISDLMEALDS